MLFSNWKFGGRTSSIAGIVVGSESSFIDSFGKYHITINNNINVIIMYLIGPLYHGSGGSISKLFSIFWSSMI